MRSIRALPGGRWLTEIDGWVLGVLGASALLRLAMMLAIRPVHYGLNDSGTYLAAASGAGGASLFYDVHHPVGYSMYLWVVGQVLDSGTALALLQHLIGLASVVLLYKAGRNVGAPRPAAAVPAAIYGTSFGIVALEHSILSEALFLPSIAIFLFFASRLFRTTAPETSWKAAAGLGLVAGAAYTIRYTGIALCPAAVLLAAALPKVSVRKRLATALVAASAAFLVVGAYVVAQDQARGFGLDVLPGSGWNHYASVAANADCRRFRPPPRTEVLCQSAAERQGKTPEYYSYFGVSPARRLEPRGFPYSDDLFEAFAGAAEGASTTGRIEGGAEPAHGPLTVVTETFSGVLTNAEIVLGGNDPPFPVDYRAPAIEENEKVLAGDLYRLDTMSFHAPLQPIRVLREGHRPNLLAGAALVFFLVALPFLTLRHAMFGLALVAVAAAWVLTGILPRYGVPVSVILAYLFVLVVAGIRPGVSLRRVGATHLKKRRFA